MVTVVTEELLRLQEALAERYIISRELARGGMAHVYLARDLRHDRDVALKILRPDIALNLGKERFLREIRIEAGLQHPHILPLHDSGVADGLLYCVMPFVQGETLRDRLSREKQLPLPDALRIAREIADALSYAHAQNIVHRDIKPGNILLSAGHAVVADFGLARAITAAAGDQVTETGIAVGTPDYMSPEQASGDTHVDGRTDLYALGCVLYEMLAGEPPFRGRTAPAILARHLQDPPPPLRTRRPNIPATVEEAVMTALAKVPADRFATAEEFVDALEGEHARPRRRPARFPRASIALAVAAGLVVALGAWGLWQVTTSRAGDLDGNRVMVFPLQSQANASLPDHAGEAVATYIGYALEGTAPLRWLEARDYIGHGESAAEADRVARDQRARYYIDGSIVGGAESVTVILRLHDVAGDSVLRRAGASSPWANASLPQLGLHAVGDLLPALLAPGRQVDLTSLSERRPTAIAHFLQGEREYRSMRFAAALEHYAKALEEDSALAVAALKGAQAAYWQDRSGEDAQLVTVALERETVLPPRLALFGRGLRSFLAGEADPAARYFRRALEADSSWSEAWMALGEVYYHLVLPVPSLDSLAEHAFGRARQADTSFTPPLFHLAEIALRRGDLPAAGRFLERLGRADPDSSFRRPLWLMQRCIRNGPHGVKWHEAAERLPTAVLAAAQRLAARGAYPACARAGFEALLNSTRVEYRWGALLGLNGLLAAAGRTSEADSVLEQAERGGLPARRLYLLNAAAIRGFDRQADSVANAWGRDYGSMTSPNLWFLAEWEASRGSLPNLMEIAEVFDRRVADSARRTDSLFARVMEARTALLQGDTAAAEAGLRRLIPAAPETDLIWQPWEGLAAERLALAEILLAQGRFLEADAIVSELDGHRAVVYLVYLPATLGLRARVAEAMGKRALAAGYLRRLATLRQQVMSSPPHVP